MCLVSLVALSTNTRPQVAHEQATRLKEREEKIAMIKKVSGQQKLAFEVGGGLVERTME